MVIKLGCKESITAINTGNKLFIKGKVYSGTTVGEKRQSVLVKDEFGVMQEITLQNDKFFKKHFKVIEDGRQQ